MGIVSNEHSVQYLLASVIWIIASYNAKDKPESPKASLNIEHHEEFVNMMDNGIVIFKKEELIIINKPAVEILETEGISQDQLKDSIIKSVLSKGHPPVSESWSHLNKLIGDINRNNDANYLTEYKSTHDS